MLAAQRVVEQELSRTEFQSAGTWAMAWRLAAPVMLVSCACYFLFFWLGSVFVANGSAVELPLRAPAWDELKWWLGRPDTGWYFSIIEGGYKAAPFVRGEAQNWAFFPAYPLIVRALSFGLRGEAMLAVGWSLAVLFYGAALCVLARLMLLDFDRDTAQRALLLLAFYPFAFSLAIFGPDSLFLLSVCGAFYAGRAGRCWLAGAAAAVACVTRVQGVAVVPCLLFEYFRQREFVWARVERSIVPLLVAPVGLVAFSAHLWRLTGNPLAFADVQTAWGNTASMPFAFLMAFWKAPKMIGHGGWDPELVSVVATCALVPLFAWAWRKHVLPAAYLIFFALQVLVMVSHSATMGNLRYITGCFPCFIALAALVKRPMTFSLVLALFAGFLGLFAALFATGQQHNPGYHFVAF